MPINKKIELLNQEISEKVDTLKSFKAACEKEKNINGSLSSEMCAKKEMIESEWKKSVSLYNELQGSIRR